MAREGLRALMAHRRLSNIADAALAWLHEQGAQYLYEVITVIDDLADHVKLKVPEKKRLLNLLEEAVSAEPDASIEAWTPAPTQADEETAADGAPGFACGFDVASAKTEYSRLDNEDATAWPEDSAVQIAEILHNGVSESEGSDDNVVADDSANDEGGHQHEEACVVVALEIPFSILVLC